MPQARVVRHVAGTGSPGYSGDGGDAACATFGGNPIERFNGPWAMVLDEAGNIFVGDTHNHVVRTIDRRTRRISTIAGRPAALPGRANDPDTTDPLLLNLPKTCALYYHQERLYVPDYQGDLVILRRNS